MESHQEEEEEEDPFIVDSDSDLDTRTNSKDTTTTTNHEEKTRTNPAAAVGVSIRMPSTAESASSIMSNSDPWPLNHPNHISTTATSTSSIVIHPQQDSSNSIIPDPSSEDAFGSRENSQSKVDNTSDFIEQVFSILGPYIQSKLSCLGLYLHRICREQGLFGVRPAESSARESDVPHNVHSPSKHSHVHVLFFILSVLTLTQTGQSLIRYILHSSWHFVLTIVGTTLGIGLGLGLGSFMKEKLEQWEDVRTTETFKSVPPMHLHPGHLSVWNDTRTTTTTTTTTSASVLASASGSTGSTDTHTRVEITTNSTSQQYPPTSNMMKLGTSSIHSANRSSTTSYIPPNNINTNHTQYDTPNSYFSLMASAGYATHTYIPSENTIHSHSQTMHSQTSEHPLLKGQILRNLSSQEDVIQKLSYISKPYGERNCIYTYPTGEHDLPTSTSKGIHTMTRMWPNLPKEVIHEIGKLEDYIARDYIMSWFASVDDSIKYENEVDRRKRTQMDDSYQNENFNTPTTTSADGTTTMLLSTSTCRSVPFIEILYTSLSNVLGNFATLCENVNIMKLLLVQFLYILKLNIKTYKDIRKSVMEKEKQRDKLTKSNSSGLKVRVGIGTTDKGAWKPSEISIVREYLLQGKFHKAITFGLDVPGLLFGDAKGNECPLPVSHQVSDIREECSDEDAVLYQRLFGNNRRALHECELDYNRVIAHRLARILFPRADFSSPLLRSAGVELIASCILTPTMGCFTPDYVNGWIMKGLQKNDNGPESEISTTRMSDSRNLPKENAAETTCFTDSSQVDRNESIDDDFDEIVEELLSEDSEEDDTEDESECNREEKDTPSDPSGESHIISAISKQDSETADEILALLAMSLIELQVYVDFEEARESYKNGEELNIRWSDKGCVETVRNLVLVIEAMIMHGALSKKRCYSTNIGTSANQEFNSVSSNTKPSGLSGLESLDKYGSLTVLLMDLTSDLDAFERLAQETQGVPTNLEDDMSTISSIKRPSAADLSTLRTLIAAWLHTGTIYRTLFVLMKSSDLLLHQFYHKNAFIRQKDHVVGFLRQLRSLQNVIILVDTPTVLSSEPLLLHQTDYQRVVTDHVDSMKSMPTKLFPATASSISNNSAQVLNQGVVVKVGALSPAILQSTLKKKKSQSNENMKLLSLGNNLGSSIRSNFDNNKKRILRIGAKADSSSPRNGFSANFSQHFHSNHLDFHRNEAFASSLRAERHSRMESFEKMNSSSSSQFLVEMICRSRVTSGEHFVEHRTLHVMAKSLFYKTHMLAMKHTNSSNQEFLVESEQPALLFESLSTQRKLELPDDDASFLLRAQPRLLTVVSIHRDERSHNLSYKKYLAYFEEPIIHKKTSSFRGAKLRRRCFVRFYPSDRTAAVNFIKNDRCLDETQGRLVDFEIKGESKQLTEFERYLCNKFVRKGSEWNMTSSLLTSTVMDSNDFNAIPRTGKSSDFIYRMTLYEEPEIELAGKRFVIQDASFLGPHRADASSLELSDASLTTALILAEKIDKRHEKHFHVQCDANGYPIAYLKSSEPKNDFGSPLANSQNMKQNDSIFRPYRISFVRAALLVQSSRKEAHLQCLMSGSIKNTSKSKIDSLLQPTLSLLDHATSKTREKQSLLLRDLKLGINHIDRDQLRRNGLLSPRYPTKLNQLKAVVESYLEVKSPGQNIDLLIPPTIIYQIRCIAISEYIGVFDHDNEDDINLEYGDLIREEWVVQRPFKEFNAFHKFLKLQVNSSESSAGTGAKLVGAAQGFASAALTLGTASSIPGLNTHKRKTLIPSLNQAAKAGALGNTKKSNEKRKEILNQYLSHLLSPRNLLNRCPELLRFLGAHDPFPGNVKMNEGIVPSFTDALGRCEMRRSLLKSNAPERSFPSPTYPIRATPSVDDDDPLELEATHMTDATSHVSSHRTSKKKHKINDPAKLAMISAIKSRIEVVKLSQVRGNVFELIRYTFDLDNNANFFRSQMVTALKTMTIAFTSAHSFRRKLLDFHLKHINGKTIAYWINYVRQLIWPNGVLFTSASPLSPEESEALATKSKVLLRDTFPEQLAAILGTDITDSGLDLIHEMLQNRLVLKSISYMMYDTLLNEITPEMGDVLTGHQVLERS